MSKLTQSVLRILLTFSILFTGLASTVGTGYAQDGSEGLVITPTILVGECGDVQFSFTVTGVTEPYSLILYLGNGKSISMEDGIATSYPYLFQGDYAWEVQVLDDDGLLGSYSDILTIEGPEVTLTSNPFPALLVAGGADSVLFTANVDGGSGTFTYEWDLDGDGSFETGETGITATGTYTEVKKYYPLVKVTDTDMCNYTTSDTMPVVVANLEDVCHPMAQKISDGVNLIFPDQSEDLYTCEDIYALFDNESEENNLGFGRMWKAYHLAESMDELTWEDILDWHLNESGWGTLLQLDRFADFMEDHDLPELMGLVMSEDFSLGDVRTAVRSVTRYEADFEDTLAMILEGANTGDINQAYKLATDEVSATDIMDMGIQTYRESLREEDMAARDLLRDEDKVARESLREEDKAAREEKQTSRTEETAEKLAEQFSAKSGDVMNLLNGECEGNWGCVRKALRDQEQEMSEGYSDKDQQTALQIGSKYGFLEEEVLAYHKDYCGEDWACTRAYFRENTLIIKETGKPNKK